MKSLSVQIKRLERFILDQTLTVDYFGFIKSVDGIGVILIWVVLLETGEMGRFKSPCNYASY